MLSEPERVILEIAGVLDALSVPYAIGGSFASGRHGEFRSTYDIDIVIDLPFEKAHTLVEALAPRYYVDEISVVDAIEHRRSFNAIHLDWMLKVDFFVARSDLLDRRQLERRRPLRIGGTEGADVQFTSAEDIILRKLDWYRQSGGQLERQLRDVEGVLKARAGQLDLAYLRATAVEVGLAILLESSLQAAGISD